MSATVVPFRPRRGATTYRSSSSRSSTPIRIDGSVSLYQLLTGLHSVGLSFRREPDTGVYVISPKTAP